MGVNTGAVFYSLHSDIFVALLKIIYRVIGLNECLSNKLIDPRREKLKFVTCTPDEEGDQLVHFTQSDQGLLCILA